jgi:hypothetical protein
MDASQPNLSVMMENSMISRFTNPDQLVKEDTGLRLVLARPQLFKLWGGVSLALALLTLVGTLSAGIYLIGGVVVLAYLGLGVLLVLSDRVVTFDAAQQAAIFSTRLLSREWQNRVISFEDIGSIYLDFEEHHYYSALTIYTPKEKISRKWLIFLVLRDRETVTVARRVERATPDRAPNLTKQTAAWEKLAERLCQLTDKLLIRTPSVPGRAPHTFVDVVNQIVQRRLAALPETAALKDRSIRLRSHPTGSMEIIVDGTHHRELSDITEPEVRELIQEAVDDWQGFAAGLPNDVLSQKKA